MYKEKYLKYKTKYLALKNQSGGGQGPPPPKKARSQAPPQHKKARSQENPQYIQRIRVVDEKVDWMVPWEGYDPPDFTHTNVLKSARANADDLATTLKWADPEDVKCIHNELKGRVTYDKDGERTTVGNVIKFKDGRPLNCIGRTGLKGRGLLGKWGPNQAADPIVTRYDPETGHLQMVAIQRGDVGQWAIPGGMVDARENVSVTLVREFTEEAGNIQDLEEKAKFDTMIDTLFANGIMVYRGYVDDPRNTDNAWMETTAFHFHCSPDIATGLNLQPGDDAVKVRWLNVDETDVRFRNLYASHKDMVYDAIRKTGLPLQITPGVNVYYQDKTHHKGGYWNHPSNDIYWEWNSENVKDGGSWTNVSW